LFKNKDKGAENKIGWLLVGSFETVKKTPIKSLIISGYCKKSQ